MKLLGRTGIYGEWLPTEISGCVLWLRADLGVTKDESERVSQWEDQSGTGNHATQATDGNKPQFSPNYQNGKPAIYFDGSSSPYDFLSIAHHSSINFTTQFSYLMVVNQPVAINFATFFLKTTDSESCTDGYGLYWSQSYNCNFFFVTSLGVWGKNTYSTGLKVWSGTYGSPAQEVRNYMNGVVGPYQGSTAMTTNTHNLCIGAHYPTGGYYPGKLYVLEFLLYNVALSTEDRQTLENYLNDRYAIY